MSWCIETRFGTPNVPYFRFSCTFLMVLCAYLTHFFNIYFSEVDFILRLMQQSRLLYL